MKYLTNEFSFDLPGHLLDRTINVFGESDNAPSDFSFVISRSPVSDDTTMASQISVLLKELAHKLSRFQLLDQTNLVLDGEPAVELRYSHTLRGKPLVQRMACLLIRSVQSGERQWISLTAAFGEDASPSWQNSFDALLQSLTVRRN